MARFRFRLDRIRKLRKHEEDVIAREMAVLLGRRREILQGIESMRERRRDLTRRRLELQLGDVDVPAVADNGAQIEATSRGEAGFRGRLVELERIITGKREELLEKSRKRKALDKLRERQLEEYRLEENRLELREANDRPRRSHGMGIA